MARCFDTSALCMCANSGIQVTLLVVQSDHSGFLQGSGQGDSYSAYNGTGLSSGECSNQPHRHHSAKFTAVTIFLQLNGRHWGRTETLYYSTQWLASCEPAQMSGETVFHSVTSFRFMCRAVTLSANCPGRALLENNLRWSVEVVNGAEGKERIPLPLKQPQATAVMHRISLGWFMCQNTDEAAFHTPPLQREYHSLVTQKRAAALTPFISVLLLKFPW